MTNNNEKITSIAVAPFSNFCDEWLLLNKSGIKESTYVKYQSILEKHIKPNIGDYNLLSIDSLILEKFKEHLLEKLSPETVKTILILTNSILKYARKCVAEPPASITIVYPKTHKKEMRVLSKDEQTRFVQFLLNDMDYCKFGVLLSLLTGMRIGEICALKKGDINLQSKTIRISATMQRLKNLDNNSNSKTKVHIGSPKTETSSRIIPLTDSMIELCKKLNYPDENDFILTGTCNYMEPRTLQYRLTKYLKKCDLEGIHFHTLRHTFATRCVEVGFEIKSLSEILGHADTSITLNRYVHSSLELKRSNMDKLSIL